MTATTARPTTTPARRTSALDRAVAARLAETEYQRYLAQLRTLGGAAWSRPTDCPAWDVRAMAAHCLGMAALASSMPEMVRQQVKAAIRHRREGGELIDALTGLQVDERRGMAPDEIVARYAETAPRAARGRRGRPAFLRRAKMSDEVVGGVSEPWTFGFLFETVLTRDTWMHRVDTARATGRELVLTPDHDGVLVADVVAEWAGRHRRPCTLTLTGPAGGTWSFGDGGPEMTLDAVEFCRILSGRARGEGLLAVEVPF